MAGSSKRGGARKPFDPSKMRVSAPLFEQTPPAEAGRDTTPTAGTDGRDARPTGETDGRDARAAGTQAERERRLTVTQLAALINGALRDGLPARVTVVGEISGFTDRTHWWFRLKDAGAVIECAMFASRARTHGPPPRDGDEVVAVGRIEHYAKQGRTQLYVDRLTPVGAGALDRRFRALCEELRGLGYFDPARKRPLPTLPRRVAVITSRTGAAVHDVIDTFRRRSPFIGLVIVDTRVQGAGAELDIAAAIERVGRERERLGVDAVLLTRGGGSIEDLWAFNERAVADAVLRCPLPVVAAIGHESDTTIAELVADERAATPTQAAVRLAPDRDALAQQVEHLRGRAHAAMTRRARQDRSRIETLADRPALRDPRTLIAAHRDRLAGLERALAGALTGRLHRAHARAAQLSARLSRRRPEAQLAQRRSRVHEAAHRLRAGAARLVERRRDRLSGLARTLDATGPVNVLKRGYTVTTRADGRLIRGPADAAEGDLIVTIGSDGRLLSTVGDHTADSPPPPEPGSPLFEPPDAAPLDGADTDG